MSSDEDLPRRKSVKLRMPKYAELYGQRSSISIVRMDQSQGSSQESTGSATPFASSSLPLSTLSSNLGELFRSADYSDITVEVGLETFQAHKAILCARVPYFKRLFDSGMRESATGRIKIEDVEADRFENVLKFIYSGQLPTDLDERSESYLPIADKYGIEDLKLASIESLRKNISQDNVVGRMILADLHQCADLKRRCFAYLRAHKSRVAPSDFEELILHPRLMLEFIKKF